MPNISAYQAKVRLSELLRDVQQGKHITITKHNVPIARLIPIQGDQKRTPAEVAAALRKFRKGKTLQGIGNPPPQQQKAG